MKVLYTHTNYILSSLFKKWVQPIVDRFMDSSLNFAQKVSKKAWTPLFDLSFDSTLQLNLIFGFTTLVTELGSQVSPWELNLSQIRTFGGLSKRSFYLKLPPLKAAIVSHYFCHRNNRRIQTVFGALWVLSRPSLEKWSVMENNWCQHKDQESVFQTPCLILLHARASSQCLKANSLLNFSCRTLYA